MLKLRMVKFFFGAALLAVTAGFAAAQNYPNKPIRLVVPFDAGGTVDTLARVVTAQITKQSGARFIIDNRPGANSAIGSEAVARATPDGYTVLNVSPSLVLNALLRKDVPYDLHKDFVPVTNLGIGQGYLLVVRQELPVKSVRELVALAKSRGDKRLTYGTPGVGNALHVASEIFATKAGIPLLHVPYKGSAPALTDAIAGQIDGLYTTTVTAEGAIRSGRVKVLGVAGPRRIAMLPNVATLAEQGITGADNLLWIGLVTAAKVPRPVVDKLNAEVNRTLQMPDVKQRFDQLGMDTEGGTPARFEQFIRAQAEALGRLIRAGVLPME